ncbi:hypothetical protein ILYODFUR_033703, partial [Ilyodon furcidens]
MNKDPSLLFLHWTKSAGSFLVPSFLGPPLANPVHPPSSAAPSPEPQDKLKPLHSSTHLLQSHRYTTSWSLYPPLADHTIVL